MTQTRPSCPSCSASMAPGVLLDRGHANANYALEWVAGSPQPHTKRVLGFKMPGLDIEGAKRHEVSSYRCSGCGLIQLYAR